MFALQKEKEIPTLKEWHSGKDRARQINSRKLIVVVVSLTLALIFIWQCANAFNRLMDPDYITILTQEYMNNIRYHTRS